ncbi:MAG: nitrous oxide reductase family maturation protein NosD [Gammaproteobacteria bacterium]
MRRLAAATATLALFFSSQHAVAFPQFFIDWQALYGDESNSAMNSGCQLCHGNVNGGSPWNDYGFDLILALEQSACDVNADGFVSSVEAFQCVEFFNSDSDTSESDNLTEILASAQPGWSIGECNTLHSSVSTMPGQPAPSINGDIDLPGTDPRIGCDTDPTDPIDPGDATIVTVSPGESIQAAIDAVAPGSTVLIEPGIYSENPGAQNGLNITKAISLIGLTDGDEGVVLRGAGNNRNGIVAVPTNRTDCLSCHASLAPPFTLHPGVPTGFGDTTPVIDGLEIRNITIDGFINNGLFTERVNDFKIVNVHSRNNRNYGIFPTLSSNGLIQNSSAVGADDSGIWVETSTNVDVIDNYSADNVNGFEVSNSDYILLEGNTSTNNTVGMSLFVLTDLVDVRPGAHKITVRNNWVYDNNKENNSSPGSILSVLEPGFGILVLGVDDSVIENNLVEDNDFFGIVMADYCLGVQGSSFDCLTNPPPAAFDPTPERNQIKRNTLNNNGTAPDPGSPFAVFAADITLFVPGDFGNCFRENTLTTFLSIAGPARPCSPLAPPFLYSDPAVGTLLPIEPIDIINPVGGAVGPVINPLRPTPRGRVQR